MKYSRFEELPVWNAAIKLAESVYQFSEDRVWAGQGSLRDQLERATVSISNNIAEGFERGSTQELLNFLYIARGSAGEARSMLCLLERLPRFSHLKFQISNLKSASEEIARQLRAWAENLQDSPIKGQRYLNEKTRRIDASKRNRDELVQELKAVQQRASR